MRVPENHWLWITAYSSWNTVFAMNYTEGFIGIIYHLGLPYAYCLFTQQWELFLMLRAFALYNFCEFATPWYWFHHELEEAPLVLNYIVYVNVWQTVNCVMAFCWALYYIRVCWTKKH